MYKVNKAIRFIALAVIISMLLYTSVFAATSVSGYSGNYPCTGSLSISGGAGTASTGTQASGGDVTVIRARIYLYYGPNNSDYLYTYDDSSGRNYASASQNVSGYSGYGTYIYASSFGAHVVQVQANNAWIANTKY